MPESKRIFVLAGEAGVIGGASKAALLLCETLCDIGHLVRLFVTLPPQLEVRRRLETRGIIVTTPNPIIPTAQCRGWRWSIPQRMIALQTFVAAWRNPPDAIHSVSLSLEARYLLQLSPSSPVYLWESTEALPHVKFLDRSIHKHLHRAAVVLAPSETIARNIRHTYGYAGLLKLLPFWVEPPAVDDVEVPPRTRNFLYIGRIDMDKGFAYLVDAFRRVKLTLADASLTICGGGDLESLLRLVRDVPGIEICGRVDSAQYEQAMRYCDAFVLPSLHEGYPLSLLEACARHRPIISTMVGSNPELFGRRDCALLVPPRDATALAEAMETLLTESDAKYKARCLDAHQLFLEVNATDIVHRQLMSVYEPLVT